MNATLVMADAIKLVSMKLEASIVNVTVDTLLIVMDSGAQVR